MFIDVAIENNIYYCADQDPSSVGKVDKVAGTVEVENVKVTGLDALAVHLGDAAAYSAGLAAASKILKGSSMPIGPKILFALTAGAGSVVTFKSVRSATSQTLYPASSKIVVEASKIQTEGSAEKTLSGVGSSGTVSASSNAERVSGSASSSYPYKSSIENNEIINDSLTDSTKDLSPQILGQIELALSLQLIICYMIFLLIIMLVAKIISEYNLTNYLSRWPLIQKFLNKIIKIWGCSSNAWLLSGLLFLFVFATVNFMSLVLIFSHI